MINWRFTYFLNRSVRTLPFKSLLALLKLGVELLEDVIEVRRTEKHRGRLALPGNEEACSLLVYLPEERAELGSGDVSGNGCRDGTFRHLSTLLWQILINQFNSRLLRQKSQGLRERGFPPVWGNGVAGRGRVGVE